MKKILILALTFSLIAAPCALADNAPPAASKGLDIIKNPYGLARKLVGDIFSAYLKPTAIQFESMVSQDFTPPRGEFIRNAQTAFYGGHILEMNYYMQSARGAKHRVFADFRWDKKTVPQAGGKVTLLKGRAQFVFSDEDGVWRLIQINGQDPFTR